MVGTMTRSQARFSRDIELAREIEKSEKIPLVRLKRYKIKARSFDIKLNGPFENHLRVLFKKFRGHSGGRNTREKARGINNLVNNRNFVVVSEDKLELQKKVKLTFVPSSDFTIEDITEERASASVNPKKKDGNNNAVVSKNQQVDNGQASNCDGTNDTSMRVPKWAMEPALTRSLTKQQKLSPDAVFDKQASIRPVDLALMFPESAQERDIWNSPPRPINYVANINNED